MLGFVNSKGEPVGEAEFLHLQAKERIKSHVKVIGSCLKATTSMTSHGVSSTSMNKTAKRVLRILSTCSLLELADCDEVVFMSPEPEALGRFSWWYVVLRAMIGLLCVVAGVGYLVTEGIIRLRGGGLNVNEQQQDVAQSAVAVEDEVDGETESQVLARYLRAPLENALTRIFGRDFDMVEKKIQTAMYQWSRQINPMIHLLQM